LTLTSASNGSGSIAIPLLVLTVIAADAVNIGDAITGKGDSYLGTGSVVEKDRHWTETYLAA
jgi:hypothetical protein